jgi:hypothetical protein
LELRRQDGNTDAQQWRRSAAIFVLVDSVVAAIAAALRGFIDGR